MLFYEAESGLCNINKHDLQQASSILILKIYFRFSTKLYGDVNDLKGLNESSAKAHKIAVNIFHKDS